MQIRDVLAFNLRKLRHNRGLSQEALANMAEVDRTYISSLERGVYAASIDMVDKLGRVLGVEAAELLTCPMPRSSHSKSADKVEY